mmetsp:Transcript_130346/g.230315  ORF Transcript_130346/g.230315 Transcript_130346/m.230315 type:complete len:107 (+) Transcript_130346:274-594(+)
MPLWQHICTPPYQSCPHCTDCRNMCLLVLRRVVLRLLHFAFSFDVGYGQQVLKHAGIEVYRLPVACSLSCMAQSVFNSTPVAESRKSLCMNLGACGHQSVQAASRM